jgi:hypothetical protein
VTKEFHFNYKKEGKVIFARKIAHNSYYVEYADSPSDSGTYAFKKKGKWLSLYKGRYKRISKKNLNFFLEKVDEWVAETILLGGFDEDRG